MSENGVPAPEGAEGYRSEQQLPPELTLPKEFDLTGKTAIVTGGSRGIGRAIALKLAYHGASVWVNSRESSRTEAERVVSDIESFGGKATYISGDITDPDARKTLIDSVMEEGHIDILVNNAGINSDMPAIGLKEDKWEPVINTNLNAPFMLTREVARQMRRQGSGQVIDISSLSADGGLVGQANYAAAKAGKEAAQRVMAREMGKDGVRFHTIRPGLVENTGMTEKLSEEHRAEFKGINGTHEAVPAEEVAEVVLFLATGRANSLTGEVISIDGASLK